MWCNKFFKSTEQHILGVDRPSSKTHHKVEMCENEQNYLSTVEIPIHLPQTVQQVRASLSAGNEYVANEIDFRVWKMQENQLRSILQYP